MKQSTAKMLLELIRLAKGVLTVLEKWIREQSGLYIRMQLGSPSDAPKPD